MMYNKADIKSTVGQEEYNKMLSKQTICVQPMSTIELNKSNTLFFSV